MTDRELLELAAKAAGIEIKGWVSFDDNESAVIGFDYLTVERWNPLTDDGDALRLAVLCSMRVNVNCLLKKIFVSYGDGPVGNQIVELFGKDRHAATRRAIVNVAAEIGKTMK